MSWEGSREGSRPLEQEEEPIGDQVDPAAALEGSLECTHSPPTHTHFPLPLSISPPSPSDLAVTPASSCCHILLALLWERPIYSQNETQCFVCQPF